MGVVLIVGGEKRSKYQQIGQQAARSRRKERKTILKANVLGDILALGGVF